ncbi:MAG: PBP1A family penicillin-binding protein [Desulfitobacterium sp.]|nr:PBP1A family penicillin-binding protein [Desulfitobacterium sp.]
MVKENLNKIKNTLIKNTLINKIKTPRQKLAKKITLRNVIILFSLIFLLGFGGSFYYIHSLDISKILTPLPQPTYIYDKDGNKISQLSSSRIVPLDLEQIPKHTQDAIIATEDKRFYDHQGVDLRAIMRALTRDLKSGDFSEGGSTISQQLVKNVFLTAEKTLSRKLKEAAYAIKIESTLSKEEILEAYLNQIYFGEGRWGIQEAARYYFGKDASDLKLEESALLAGLLKAPNVYSPLKDRELALKRRNIVLTLMKEQGYISETEYSQTIVAPIALRKKPLDDLSGKYAPYVDYVLEEGINRYGFTEEQILTGGLQIYTQLDPTVQDPLEKVYKDDNYFPQGTEEQIVQSGMVIIDHKTGGIRGLVGYRGESAFRQFNRASQLKRQPGSVLKPLIVYGPALEEGYTPGTYLYDGPLDIDGYSPRNWDNNYRDWVTMVEAVEQSWNVPAVWLLDQIGIDTGKVFAQRAGIPFAPEDNYLSLALGGMTVGISPLDLAQAYSAFPNQGVMMEAHAITKITTTDGHILCEAEPDSVQVTDPHHAHTMTLLLKNAVENGTAHRASLGERPVAGKTGSVELPPTEEFAGISKGQKDVWFVGYTPELTGAIWMGYDHTDRNHYLTTAGGAESALVFRQVFSEALASVPTTEFIAPEGYVMDYALYPKGYWDDLLKEKIIEISTKRIAISGRIGTSGITG